MYWLLVKDSEGISHMEFDIAKAISESGDPWDWYPPPEIVEGVMFIAHSDTPLNDTIMAHACALKRYNGLGELGLDYSYYNEDIHIWDWRRFAVYNYGQDTNYYVKYICQAVND